MRNIVVFGGRSHPELVQSICERLGIPAGQVVLGQFSNKETSVQILESVRDLDVFIIQTAAGHVNNNLMELMIMIAACKMASARRITVVLPCFPYARQPDVPYKRSSGMPRRLHAESSATGTTSANHVHSHAGNQIANGGTTLSTVDAPASFAAGAGTKSASPVAAQLQKQLEERQQAKMKRINEGGGANALYRKSISGHQTPANTLDTLSAASSASNSSPHSPERENARSVASPLMQQEPIFASGEESSRSRSPARDRKVVELRRLEMTEASTSGDGRVTVISSPMVTQSNALGLPKGHYRHWTARSGTLIANLLVAAGTNHLITMDLHDPQFQGFFDIPVDNLSGSPLMVKYICEKLPDYKKAVIVSPDAGGAKRAANIAHKLGMEFALIHKERKYHHPHNQNANNNSQLFSTPLQHRSQQQQQQQEEEFKQQMLLVGNVQDKTCILVDDIADTSNTITKAAQLLHSKGAKKIFAIVTHGILSGSAVQRLKSSPIDQIIVSDTVPQSEHIKELGSRIRVFEVAPILAEAIRRIHHGESVSYLFEPVDI